MTTEHRSTEPRCYHCQTLLPDINAACPNCLPNFYSSQVPPRQAPPSSKERALADAERSSAFWKAELIAANVEIAQLRATAKVQTERAELAEQRLSEAHQEIGGLRETVRLREARIRELEPGNTAYVPLSAAPETKARRLPDDPRELLVTTARDAGFSDAQWKSMFYESGPYDVTFPSFTTKKFIALLLERLQGKTGDFPLIGTELYELRELANLQACPLGIATRLLALVMRMEELALQSEKTGDDGLCWIKGCQRLRGHEGFCDPLPAPDVNGER